MTLKLTDGQTDYQMSFNLVNVTGSWTLTLTSQVSNLPILEDLPLTIEETNDRYTEFSFTIPTDLPEEHKNGIYTYTLTDGNVSETGLLKLVCGSGGGTGTVSYTSNNENQEAPIYYRPQY